MFFPLSYLVIHPMTPVWVQTQAGDNCSKETPTGELQGNTVVFYLHVSLADEGHD